MQGRSGKDRLVYLFDTDIITLVTINPMRASEPFDFAPPSLAVVTNQTLEKKGVTLDSQNMGTPSDEARNSH